MNILIISLDKGILGKGELGDVIERHREYGKYADKIDIIVFSKKGYDDFRLSENVCSYPTNSPFRCFYWYNGYKRAKQLFQKTHYDLIVTQDPFVTALLGATLKKKFGSKLLVHFHGDFFDNPSFLKEDWKNIFFVLLAKRNIKKADGLRVMSSGIQKKLEAQGILKNKIQVIPTPVNIQKFLVANAEMVESIRKEYQNKKIILFVGRLEKVKDVPTLIYAYAEVARNYPSSVLLIIGKGSEEEKLKSFCQEKNIDANFLGQKDHESLIHYYHACDMLALTSLSESFGKVLIEASACGKPVVSTATTGAKDIIQDGHNGYLVDVGDSRALAQKILFLLQNPYAAKKIGENGKEHVFKNFDSKASVEKIATYWKDIVGAVESASFLRQEIKFLVPMHSLNAIIHEIHARLDFDEYSLLGQNNFYKIINIYYDTDDFQCYYERKDLSKELVKYRLRIYVEPKTEDCIVYPEIKTRKGKFVKKLRIRIRYADFIRALEKSTLEKTLNLSEESRGIMKEFFHIVHVDKMKPVVLVNYRRCALNKKKDSDLRVTFDKGFMVDKFQNLTNASSGNAILEDLSIMEVKYSGALPGWLEDMIAKYQLKEFLDSKYCITAKKLFNLQ